MNIEHIKKFLSDVSGSSQDCKVEFYFSSDGNLIADFMALRDGWSHYIIHMNERTLEDFLVSERLAEECVKEFTGIFRIKEEGTYEYLYSPESGREMKIINYSAILD